MPDPTRLLTTLARAREASLDTPGRTGHLVALTDAAEVLVAGDLHGNLENFRRLLQLADLANQPQRHLVLQELIHGPHRYPEGGDRSHQLLDVVAALKCQYPRQVHLLPGNHELAQWTNRRIGKEEEVDLLDQFWQGVWQAYGDHAEEVYLAYLALFAVLPMAVRTANRVFISHSLPSALRVEHFDPAVLLLEEFPESELIPGGSIYSLLWGRDTQPSTARRFLEKVDADWLLTGHIPCEHGFAVPNDWQIILDSLGSPAGYCLVATDRPLQHSDLINAVQTFQVF